MTFLIVLACVALTAALGYWIFTATPEPEPAEDIERQALLDRKKAVYDNLRDLHFEHLAGKLSAADYERTRRMLETEAAGVNAGLQKI